MSCNLAYVETQTFPAIFTRPLPFFLPPPWEVFLAERSFSALRPLKLWSTMNEERLSGLGMLLILHTGT